MRSCLVVDASHVVRTVARNILEELGFTVAEAATGLAAIEYCRATPPDMVLLEWDLPDMPGLKVLKLLRDQGGGPSPAIVFCTRRDGAAEMVEAVREGAAEYIVKPFDNEVLRAKLLSAGLVP
jgi:two-component system, chemotaxis family, chemotaxis protein CheY